MTHRMDSTNDESTVTAAEARAARAPEVVLARCERCDSPLSVDPARARRGELGVGPAPHWCPNGHGLHWYRGVYAGRRVEVAT